MSAMEVSVIGRAYAEAVAAVGRSRRVDLGSVAKRDLARFAAAVTGSVAGPSVVGGRPHPLFLSSVLGWGDGPREDELMADGNAADPFAGVALDGLRLMGGGQQLTFHRDLTPDVPVTMDTSIVDCQLRQTRGGALLVLVLERRYSDADGALVECRETFLGREEAG